MALLDANGVAISVGDTVYIACTVLSLDPADTHFGEVKVQINHSLAGTPNYVPNPEVAGFAPAIHGPRVHSPRADQVLKCAPLMLNH